MENLIIYVVGSVNENKIKKITVEPLLKNYTKMIHLFIDRRLRSCTCFWT
jgi:hypothetical protein